jgi:capsular polysaccharide transport system permease protein
LSDKQPKAAPSAAKAEGGQATAAAKKPKRKPAAKPTPGQGAANRAVKPPAQAARRHRRHGMLMLSFVLIVVLPAVTVAAYLAMRAEDQYASTLGFVVRKEETSSAVELLGGLTQLSGSSSSDTDILNEFIQSQQLVRQVDAKLKLREIYSRNYETDPVFSFDPTGKIEDLVDYWGRMVKIYYDPGSGLIELQVKAFAPDEAQAIAEEIFAQSSAMINQLSAIAREDTMRYAREELELSIARLKEARQAVAQFRSVTRIVDPEADLQVRMGLLSNLQQQLAAALIEGDLLIQTTRAGDPRIDQTARRIAVIRARIAEERNKFTIGDEGSVGEEYINVLSEFERLSVDREFAERAYLASLTAFDVAQAEAQRTSRYLAAYITPTLPEEALYPQRITIGGLVAAFLLMIWAVGVLIYYSVKDRR